MPKPTRKIKLSKNLRPFVARVVRDGAVQRAFAARIGRPVGACVKSGVKKGMSGAAIRRVVTDCAKGSRGTKLKTNDTWLTEELEVPAAPKAKK